MAHPGTRTRCLVCAPTARVKDLPDIALLGTAQWSTPYGELARENELGWTTLEELTVAVGAFRNPVLAGRPERHLASDGNGNGHERDIPPCRSSQALLEPATGLMLTNCDPRPGRNPSCAFECPRHFTY